MSIYIRVNVEEKSQSRSILQQSGSTLRLFKFTDNRIKTYICKYKPDFCPAAFRVRPVHVYSVEICLKCLLGILFSTIIFVKDNK